MRLYAQFGKMTTADKYSSVFTKEEIIKIVQNDLETTDIELVDYCLKPASETTLGFLGEHLKIHVEVKVRGEKKERNYFVKKTPSIREIAEYTEETRCFYKEIEFYKTLYKDLLNAQRSREVKWCPKYVYSRDHDIVVVEDLSVLGYSMYPERQMPDLEHMKAGMRCMAVYHAAGFIFEVKFNRGEVGTVRQEWQGRKGTLGELYEHIKFETETTDEVGHVGNTLCEVGFKSQVAIVDLLPGFTDAERTRIKAEMPGRLRKMLQFVKPSQKYRNIFLHGDIWTNNILFKKETDGVLKAILVDYQMIRYAPPANDIIFFIHIAQNKAFRDQHQPELLKTYYETLEKEIHENGLTMSDVGYSWEELLESVDEYYEFGLLTCSWAVQLTLQPSDVTERVMSNRETYNQIMFVDRSSILVEGYKDEVYRTRVTEVLDELIRKYILV